MDRNGLSGKDRAALRRIIVLLLGLADLAEAAGLRSRPVRWLALAILRLGEVVAQDYVASLAGIAADEWSTMPAVDPDDGFVEAARLALFFRAMAAALAALPDEAAAAGSAIEPRSHAALAAFRDFAKALSVELRDSS